MVNRPPENDGLPSLSRLIGQYIACYSIWLAICAAGLWLLFQARQLVMSVAIYFRFNPWQVRALDKWGIFGLGLLFFVAIFVLEGYLRQSVSEGRLWQKSTRSLIMLIVITVFIVGFNLLFTFFS